MVKCFLLIAPDFFQAFVELVVGLSQFVLNGESDAGLVVLEERTLRDAFQVLFVHGVVASELQNKPPHDAATNWYLSIICEIVIINIILKKARVWFPEMQE
jgi:hypothetical protein